LRILYKKRLYPYRTLLEIDFCDGFTDKSYIEEYAASSKNQIKHTLDTLDEFRAFFRSNTKKEQFSLARMIEETLVLIKDELMSVRIHMLRILKMEQSLL